MTILKSRSAEALDARRALAALLLVAICPALFAGIPRLAADSIDAFGFEETVPTFLVASAVLPSPEASVAGPAPPAMPPLRRADFRSPLSLRAPPDA